MLAACSLLPILRAAAESDKGAWAKHLRMFEREEREPTGDDADGDRDPTAPPAKEETMAELFARLMPQADPRAQAEVMRKWGMQQPPPS